MKKTLIGGIGNVLLGDDGIGPYVIHMLESRYAFEEDVEVADLGTPALDLTHRIAGLHSVILVDCIASSDHEPGTVLLYDKEEIMRQVPSQRLDPHSPALVECLMTADMLGAMPERVLLVGIVGATFEPGETISPVVREAAGAAISELLHCLKQQGTNVKEKMIPSDPAMWWSTEFAISSSPAQG